MRVPRRWTLALDPHPDAKPHPWETCGQKTCPEVTPKVVLIELLTCARCGHEQMDHAFGEGYCDICPPCEQTDHPSLVRFSSSCREFQ